MDSDLTVPQSVAEAPVVPQNDRLKLYQENLVQALTEKLQPFGEKMNPKVLEMATKDRSQEKDYKVEVIDNPWSEGIIDVQEGWDGGQRHITVYDDRYKSKSEYDTQPDTFIMGFTEGKSDYDKWGASMLFNPRNSSLSQEISCTTQRATKAEYGAKPLMSGEFFKWAGSGNMTEKTFIEKDGTVSSSKFWSENNKWLGGRPERYQTTFVKESNGVVEKGTAIHGVALGVVPVMEVVYNGGRR